MAHNVSPIVTHAPVLSQFTGSSCISMQRWPCNFLEIVRMNRCIIFTVVIYPINNIRQLPALMCAL